MKISESWLRHFVNPPVDTQAMADALTMVGLEIEGIHAVAGDFTRVVVAEITDIIPHPDAERLRICTVSSGQESWTVVCGAENARAGLKAPLAMIDAMLPNDFKIRESKLRGVLSQGMLCSASELGLAAESKGLLELPHDAPVGKDLREYLELNDRVIEVSLTPNRGDCLSVLGVARELSAIYSLPIKNEASVVPSAIKDQMSVDLKPEAACAHYCSRVIKNINIQSKSPLWLQERLRRSGIRSISPVVDVTNVVMLELGQPMHAFDFEKIDSGLVVRLAEAGEKIKLLDESEVVLKSETTVIADHKKALAIAGVMGGLDSGVSVSTKSIVFEAAFFDPLSIAKTTKVYNLKSESSYRFERGVDPRLPKKAIERATELLLSIAGGEAGPVLEQSIASKCPAARTVVLRHARLESLLGLSIDAARIESILKSLNMQTSKTKEGWSVSPSSYRFDIAIEEDLIEEVARIYGYDHLPSTPLQQGRVLEPVNVSQTLRSQAKYLLSNRGYHEVVSYSFVDEKLQTLLGLSEGQVPLMNPISSEMSVMRTSLLPGLLSSLLYNVNRQQTRVRLFEQGLCFKQEKTLQQEPFIAGLLMGSRLPEQWGAPSMTVDFFDVKGDCEVLLSLFDDVSKFEYRAAQHSALHPGQSADIVYKNEVIGFVGAVHPNVLKFLDVPGPVFVFQCQLTNFAKQSTVVYGPVSKFPAIRRDIALIVDDAHSAESLQSCIASAAGGLLIDLQLFDVYVGKGVPEHHKSMAFALVLQHRDRTLVDDEVAALMQRVVDAAQKEFGAVLR